MFALITPTDKNEHETAPIKHSLDRPSPRQEESNKGTHGDRKRAPNPLPAFHEGRRKYAVLVFLLVIVAQALVIKLFPCLRVGVFLRTLTPRITIISY